MRPLARLAVLLLLTGAPAWSGDGRFEINQTTVEAAGGFPFAITLPGSYVLTGRLDVPADTDGILVQADDVDIDLNGFTISGPFVCSAGSCAPGAGRGIGFNPPFNQAKTTSVHGGTVRGFANTCVSVFSESRVSDVRVESCGGGGIGAFGGSQVLRNRVSDVGQHGIAFRPDPSGRPAGLVAHNVVVRTGLADASRVPISEGLATAGNFCDRTCTTLGSRRFYLTKQSFEGPDADEPGTCAAGYHFASIWEILDVSRLEYDRELGFVFTPPDSEGGPPTDREGWIATGRFPVSTQMPGQNNCSAWSSTTGSGTVVTLEFVWTNAATVISPFKARSFACVDTRQVWCVQD